MKAYPIEEEFMAKKTEKSPVRILLLVGDFIGSNGMMGGKRLAIIDKFRPYGWEVTLVGISDRVSPCPFAAKSGVKPLELDCTIDAIEDVAAFDAVSVLPGTSHKGLIESECAMSLIRTACESGVVVSGWCRGDRTLAAAGVLSGKNVVGHADDPAAGGTLVTGARSYYYRAKNADAIGDVVRERARSPALASVPLSGDRGVV